jgi:holliday junction DNA helicase RuvA
MIARLRGIVEEKSSERVVIDVNGVGYGLVVPETILLRMPAQGAEVTLQVYTHVREDALLLFGFLTHLERDVFEILISASGVGPKLATAILSALDAMQILEAIAYGNKAGLNGITGVGKKTAERLVLELKEKCEKRLLLERGSAGAGGKHKSVAVPMATGLYAWLSDLESALQGLGYKDNDIREVTRQVLGELKEDNFEAALKLALQKMGQMHSKTLRGTA